MATPTIRIGIAVTTVGRWDALERLLESVARSTYPDTAVAVANQSGGVAPRSLSSFGPVEVMESSGGISKGRNAAMEALRGMTDLVTFPNDHSWYEPTTLSDAARSFADFAGAGALAGSLVEPTGPRMVLPPAGTPLNRWTVWRAIEPAMFLASELVEAHGFRDDLGVGGSTPWQAGEGTELLLRILGSGRPVLSAPHLVVRGDGERRTLDPEEWRTKLRSYARGVGYVLRIHHAGVAETVLQLAVPWRRMLSPPPGHRRTPARDCLAASLGRLEGRLGRCFGTGATLDRTALRK